MGKSPENKEAPSPMEMPPKKDNSGTIKALGTDSRRAGGWECPHCGKRH